MDIIISKYIGIRGTAILARERREELLSRYPEWIIDEAASFDNDLEDYQIENDQIEEALNEDSSIKDDSIEIGRIGENLIKDSSIKDDSELLKDVRIALDQGASYAKEYTEFGVFEALFQMAKTLKCGIRVNIKDIPIRQETVEVSEFLGVNPYALYSGNSAIIVASDGAKIVSKLEENGIAARIAGYTTKDDNDKIVINEDERGFLQHIRKDELKNILGRRDYHERTDSINC